MAQLLVARFSKYIHLLQAYSVYKYKSIAILIEKIPYTSFRSQSGNDWTICTPVKLYGTKLNCHRLWGKLDEGWRSLVPVNLPEETLQKYKQVAGFGEYQLHWKYMGK